MITLYKYSFDFALRDGQKKIWQESHKENIRCRNAIEQAIRENYDGMHLNKDTAKIVLDEFSYDRTMWVLAGTIKFKDYDGRFSQDNKKWAKGIFLPQGDRNRLCEFCVESHPAVLDGFVNEVRRAYQALGLADYKQCEQHEFSQDYEGKLLILKPEMLREQYKSPVNQYFMAKGGFGCSPTASGRKVFGYFLSDGKQSHFNRADFLGIADKEQLPEWAQEKLAALQPQQEHTQEEGPVMSE